MTLIIQYSAGLECFRLETKGRFPGTVVLETKFGTVYWGSTWHGLNWMVFSKHCVNNDSCSPNSHGSVEIESQTKDHCFLCLRFRVILHEKTALGGSWKTWISWVEPPEVQTSNRDKWSKTWWASTPSRYFFWLLTSGQHFEEWRSKETATESRVQ